MEINFCSPTAGTMTTKSTKNNLSFHLLGAGGSLGGANKRSGSGFSVHIMIFPDLNSFWRLLLAKTRCLCRLLRRLSPKKCHNFARLIHIFVFRPKVSGCIFYVPNCFSVEKMFGPDSCLFNLLFVAGRDKYDSRRCRCRCRRICLYKLRVRVDAYELKQISIVFQNPMSSVGHVRAPIGNGKI